MKVSVITAVRNDVRIINAIRSVAQQKSVMLEHIIVDGASNDGTLELITQQENPNIKLISEPDMGIYDAFNKGIMQATGDVVGFLNADDWFASSNTLKHIVDSLESSSCQVVHGNVRYVDSSGITKRRWKSCSYRRGLFQKSWTPAHPTFYTYRTNYKKFGLYRTDFQIAADVELMYRFLEVHGLSSYYIPEELVVMSAGGQSNRGIGSTVTIYREVRQAIIENGGSFSDIKYLLNKILKLKEYYIN
ncbi:MAG: glycosyltransferase [Spirochaetales bacterium]|nr:glycosyltransferase [Spirochaetales bacterium]